MTLITRNTMTDLIVRPVIGRWAAGAVVLWVTVFLGLPITVIITGSVAMDDVTRVLTQQSTWRLVWFSTWQAALSVLVTFVISGPVTWLIGRHQFHGRRVLRAITTVGFLLPSVVVATAFLAVLPRSLHYTVFAVIVAHAYFNIAVVVRVVGARLELLEPQLAGVARTLGASPLVAMRTITWPLVRSAVSSAASVMFLYCFTSFAVVRVLGGPRRSTLESDISLRAFGIGDVGGATVLALVQLTYICVVVGIIRLLMRSDIAYVRAAPPVLPALPHQFRSTASVIASVTVIFVVAPLVALLWRSLHVRDRMSLEAWRSLFDTTLAESLRASARTALVAGVLGTLLCCIATLAVVHLRRGGRAIDALTLLTLAMSPVTVGLGLIITFDSGWFDWRDRWWFVAIAHTLVAFPLAVRVLVPAWRTTPVGLHHAAAVLGANGWRRLVDVDLRRMRPALVAALGLIIAVSLGEFGAASMLSRDGAETMPVAISRLLSRTGDVVRAQAFAMASLLVVVCTAALIVVESAMKRGDHAAGR